MKIPNYATPFLHAPPRDADRIKSTCLLHVHAVARTAEDGTVLQTLGAEQSARKFRSRRGNTVSQ